MCGGDRPPLPKNILKYAQNIAKSAKIWSIFSENFVPAASGAARPEPAALGSAAAPAASTASRAAHKYHELIHGLIHELIRMNRMNSWIDSNKWRIRTWCSSPAWLVSMAQESSSCRKYPSNMPKYRKISVKFP